MPLGDRSLGGITHLRIPPGTSKATQIGRSMSGRPSYRKMMFSKSNGYSMMPVVGTRTRSTSCCVGTNEGMAMRSMSVR